MEGLAAKKKTVWLKHIHIFEFAKIHYIYVHVKRFILHIIPVPTNQYTIL